MQFYANVMLNLFQYLIVSAKSKIPKQVRNDEIFVLVTLIRDCFEMEIFPIFGIQGYGFSDFARSNVENRTF